MELVNNHNHSFILTTGSVGKRNVLQRLKKIASFLSVDNWTSIMYFLSFSFFFCNHFHKDGLHLSHAQMYNIVVLLLRW